MKSVNKTKVTVSLLALFVAAPVAGLSAVNDASLFPPNAEPGKCYAKVMIPAKMKKVTEEVIKKEGAEKVEIIPPKWEVVEKKVMIKEPVEKLEIVPATYKTVEEKIEIAPPSTKLIAVDPVYETVEEKVLDKPARTVWKKGSGLIEKVDNVTGDIMCLVNEPATYKTIKKQVLKTPASVKKVEIPGEYKVVKKKVVDKPAQVTKTIIPAEYQTVKVKKLVEPAKEERIKIPEEKQVVTKMVKESDDIMTWRPVLCETNMTKDVIIKIQQALADKGYNPGPIDGSIGGGTVSALAKFQKDNNLARGGITYETLDALKVFVK